MSFKPVFSNSMKAIQKRIKNLPTIALHAVNTIYKKDAVGFIVEFEKGLNSRSFGLTPLKPKTIEKKKKLGLKKPKTELIGRGKDDIDSYINLFRIRKAKNGNGWIVTPREDSHYSGVEFKKMFFIHEYGATIEYTNEKGNQVLIRIPPRPAMRKAFNRYLRRYGKKDTIKQVKKAIAQIIKDGKSAAITKIQSQDKYNAYDY